MKILVTGGAGLVGSHAAEYFARKGWEVIAYDNLSRSSIFGCMAKSVEYNWEYLGRYKNITRIKADVRDPVALEAAIPSGIDAVIHTAGQPGVPSSVRDPLGDFSINAQGTLQVLEAVRKKNNKAVFIYTSTNKVYGENVDKIPLREEQTRFCFAGKIKGVNEGLSVDNTARTPYGTSKLTGDLYVQEYGYLYGLDTYCFRMSCIYGERQFGFEDQGWVAHFIFSLLKDKPVTIFGNGKQVRDLLYAQDLIRAFEAAIVKRPQSRVFNIGGGIDNTLSLLEFCDYLGKKSGNKLGLRFEPERPSDQKVYISDFSLFTRETGWQPQIGVREGIDRLYEWAADYLSSENRRHLPAGEAGNTEVR